MSNPGLMERRSVRALMATGVAAATLGTLSVVQNVDGMSFSASETNRAVDACANALGEVATKSTAIPVVCRKYYTPEKFDSTTTVVTRRDASDNRILTASSKTIYSLTSGKTFYQENHLSAEQIHQHGTRLRYANAGMAGLLGLWGYGVFSLSVMQSKQRRRDEQEATS